LSRSFRVAADAARTVALRLFSSVPAEKALSAPKNILVLGYGAIGDTLFFLPVLEGLRGAHPQARITWVADLAPGFKELIPATGLVDENWFVKINEPDRAAVNARIAAAKFDWAVMSLSSSADFFQQGLSSIPVRAGHTTELSGGPWRRIRQALVMGELTRRALLNRTALISLGSEHAVARNSRLLTVLGVPAPTGRPRLPLSKEHHAFAERAMAQLTPGRRRLAIHLGIGPGQYHKFWDAEKFGRLLASITANFNVDLIAVGTADEAPSLEKARRKCPTLQSCIGTAGLMETFAVIAACDGFIGNDTGLSKAAMALGIPTATIWGPSDAREVGVFWDPQKHADVFSGIACNPCARLGMPKGSYNYLTCGHHDCLGRLEPDFVFERLKPWLSERLA